MILLKHYIHKYGRSLLYITFILSLSCIDTANAFNFGAPFKAKTQQFLTQIKVVSACLSVFGVCWIAYLLMTASKMHALKYAVGLFIGGIIIGNVESIVRFMGFTF